MKHLPKKQQALLTELLSGDSIRKCAERAKVSYDWARQLVSNRDPENTQAFYDEFEKQLGWQRERLIAEADRTKEGLLQELELVAEKCQQEFDYVDARGNHRTSPPDLTNWVRTIIERGKLLGYYVDKKEISGKLSVADIIGSVDLDED